MELKVKLSRGAELPRYAKAGDAGLDLTARESCVIDPGKRYLMPTGVAVEIPEGYMGLVLPRSGLALKYGLTVANAPGLIDSGYRGEVSAILLNTSKGHSIEIEEGERICQLVVVPFASVEPVAVVELDGTSRGTDGFGSTGTM